MGKGTASSSRVRMEGPLEEAWAVAKAAKDLRCALEGGGSGGCLHHLAGTSCWVDFFVWGGPQKNRLEKKESKHFFWICLKTVDFRVFFPRCWKKVFVMFVVGCFWLFFKRSFFTMCVAGHDEALLDEMLKEAEKHSRFLKLFVYLPTFLPL